MDAANATNLAAIAGTAGGVAMVLTTTVIRKAHSFTAEGRAQALDDLYHGVNARHQIFLNTLLPMLDESYKKEAPFTSVANTTKSLKLYDHSLRFLMSVSNTHPTQCRDPEEQYNE